MSAALIDSALLEEWGARVGRFLTVEDHSVRGGLGSAVCEVVSESSPGVTVRRHGVRDFGESGSAAALYRKHRLDADGIPAEAREMLRSAAPIGESRRRAGARPG